MSKRNGESRIDRRVSFFAIAGLICVLLVPAAPPDFRTVCWVVAAAYFVLSGAWALDAHSRTRQARASELERERGRQRATDRSGEQRP
jgi:hypothetical protein